MFIVSDEKIAAFLKELDSKDTYTREHSIRVGELMERFATEMRLPDVHVRQMMIAGLLHDAGKLDIPDEILHKISHGESLAADEKKALEKHVESDGLLSSVGDLPVTVKLAIRHHHENWDGEGFPDRPGGPAIPPSARMLAVCDVFAAVTADLPGRKGLKPRKAATLLKKLGGSRLDPKLADVFIAKIVTPDIPVSIFRKIINFFRRIIKPDLFTVTMKNRENG
jgi:HD-GYP domain-containing protein (c-di-GMP phosphodiesterase class II)